MTKVSKLVPGLDIYQV